MLCNNLEAHGELHLADAKISGTLDLHNATLINAAGKALYLEDAEIGTLILTPKQAPDGAVDLTNAKATRFTDDQGTWPRTLVLRGFTYGTLENDQLSVRSRLSWLARQPSGPVPQTYDQLAAAYRRAGQEEAVRKVAVAKQWHNRHALNPLNWLWYATVGYGYRPWLAGIWLMLLISLGTWIFGGAYPAHMVATQPHPPAFNQFAYTLDVLLPIVDLGQKSAWRPQGPALYCSWGLPIAGWVLTTAVVAGLTGILKRD